MPEAEAGLHMAKPTVGGARQPCSPSQAPPTFSRNGSRGRLLLCPQGAGGHCFSSRRLCWSLVLLKPCPDGWASPPSLPLFFQVIRKVVRQVDPSGAVDTQQHEEVIVEGSLTDPGDLDADIESFMRLTKVPRRGRPLGASSKVTSASPLLSSRSQCCPWLPLWCTDGTVLPAPPPRCPVPFSFLPLLARLPV